MTAKRLSTSMFQKTTRAHTLVMRIHLSWRFPKGLMVPHLPGIVWGGSTGICWKLLLYQCKFQLWSDRCNMVLKSSEAHESVGNDTDGLRKTLLSEWSILPKSSAHHHVSLLVKVPIERLEALGSWYLPCSKYQDGAKDSVSVPELKHSFLLFLSCKKPICTI